MKLIYCIVLLFILPLLTHAETSSISKPVDDITELDIKDLLNVQVTSVSKKAQALSDAPSAIYVISQDDIKRSGVTSIPEALRMAPGIDVARINSNKWAISARGFNGSLANKLQVLIDGRSVYTPSFSGVYWDAQDVLMEDIERIEVIRGPGATLWGANAVNGVINIITKSADKTQGGLLIGGGGDRETGFGGLRYGSKLGEDTYGRAYLKGFERDNYKLPDGTENANDSWSRVQGGFKLESRLNDKDELTFQGDIYHTDFNQRFQQYSLQPPFTQIANDSAENNGWNVTSRWRHKVSSTSEYSLQFYYDHSRRDDFLIDQQLDVFDLDFQHNFEFAKSHNLIWGLGYRANLDSFAKSGFTELVMSPKRRNTQLFSAFLQDEIELIENRLWLTVGSKFEHNDYTGFEGQPSARFMWAPTPKQRVWGAFSRSVRIPSRYESNIAGDLVTFRPGTVLPDGTQLPFPTALRILGNPNFVSEVQLSYELGYRLAFSDKASVDLTGFYNDYDKIRGVEIGDPFIEADPLHLDIPISFVNSLRANAAGFEAALSWQMTDWIRWDTNYSFLATNYKSPNDSQDARSPDHKVSLRAVINPSDNVNLDFWLRYNGEAQVLNPINAISQPTRRAINGYLTLDVRLAWKPIPALELSFVGQNLLDGQHLEYIDETYVLPTAIPRSFYGKIAFEF